MYKIVKCNSKYNKNETLFFVYNHDVYKCETLNGETKLYRLIDEEQGYEEVNEHKEKETVLDYYYGIFM